MKLVYNCTEIVAGFVAERIPFCVAHGFGKCTAIGVVDGDRLVGGFVFRNYTPEAGVIEVSFAGIGKRWLTRPVLYGVFSYAFDGCSCQMVCSQTPASYKAAARIARAYGFKQVTVPRLFGRDEDGIVSTLTVEDWRSNGFHKEHRNGPL